MPDGIAISARGLTRYFGNVPVVRQLDLDIPHGSVTGLLGLNGLGRQPRFACYLAYLNRRGGLAKYLARNLELLVQKIAPELAIQLKVTLSTAGCPYAKANTFSDARFRGGMNSYFQKRHDDLGLILRKKFAPSVAVNAPGCPWLSLSQLSQNCLFSMIPHWDSIK